MTDANEMREANRRTYLEVGHIYDALLSYRTADLPFWEQLALEAGGPFVEVGCGTGRILAAVARKGVAVCGIDSSPQMLALCEQRLAAVPGAEFTLVEADFEAVTSLPVNPAVVAFTLGSFQYCLDGHLDVLKRFRATMKVGARLILDAKNFYADRKFTAGLHDVAPGRPYDVKLDRFDLSVVEEVRFEPFTQMVQESARYWVREPGPRHEIRIEQYMRSFSLHELRLLMTAAGFELGAVWRGYEAPADGAAAATGPRVIVEGRAA